MNEYLRLANKNIKNIQRYELNPINVPKKILNCRKKKHISTQRNPRGLLGLATERS
jgi:hypothetical protein